MATWLEVITDAYYELGVLNAADTLSAEDAALGLSRLNDLLDLWNAERQTIYREQFNTFTITPNLQPHTIGPSGATWTMTTNRPVSIDGANLVLNTSTPDIHIPLEILTYPEWLMLPTPAQTGSVPTKLYYDPTWPNGSVYLWTVPTVAYEIQLMTRAVLAQVALSDTFTLPPGYKTAITLTLTEDLSAPLNAPVKPSTTQKATKARAQIFSNNVEIPKLRTQNAGMPRTSQSGVRCDFFYPNGQVIR